MALPELRRLALIGIVPACCSMRCTIWHGIPGVLAAVVELGVKSMARIRRPAAVAKIREKRDVVERGNVE